MAPKKRPANTPEPTRMTLPWVLVPQIYSLAARLLDRRLAALDVTDEQARFLAVLVEHRRWDQPPLRVLASAGKRASGADLCCRRGADRRCGHDQRPRYAVRASALKAEGNLRLACHIVEFAVLAEPASKEAHAVRRDVYAARSKLEESSMSRNILNHAALASEQGKRDLAGEY